MNHSPEPLNLAVVGHTNTGKTSLLRTLLRDENFGEIADEPGTTRHVESVKLITESGLNVLNLHDTPGLEDAMRLLDYMDNLIGQNRRLDGPERIQTLLVSPAAEQQFEQEARVLKAILKSDAALYVIDTRDPVLPKHKDELVLLAACGKPILPVLNFTRNPKANPKDWRTALARIGLHTVLDFDTVAPALDGESQLIDKLSLMLDDYRTNLDILRKDLEQQKEQRRKDACKLIAELLIDAASFRVQSSNEESELERQTQKFRIQIKDREQSCVKALLKCYQFSTQVFPYHQIPLSGERWGMDLFNPKALKTFGIEVSKGIATGAMAGLTIDALTGGLSLGSATLIGALAGGSWQGLNKWGRKISNYISGMIEISVDEPVLELLALRQLALVHALEQRGHAATKPIAKLTPEQQKHQDTDESVDTKQQRQNELPTSIKNTLRDARANPDWSSIKKGAKPDTDRDLAITKISTALHKLI